MGRLQEAAKKKTLSDKTRFSKKSDLWLPDLRNNLAGYKLAVLSRDPSGQLSLQHDVSNATRKKWTSMSKLHMRKMTENPDSRKRSKRHYANFGNKKFKSSRELEVGMQGILITCNMTERKCTSEAYSLLNEYADKLYGPEEFSDHGESDSEGDDATDEDDAEEALKKEIKQMRSSTQKMERRFQALESGANNVIFIRTQHLDPDKLVHHILQDLHKTKKKKSRVILRMLPVSGTCKAFIGDMEKYLENFLEPWFRAPNQGTFQIAFKARNSSHNKREEVIKVLAALVGKMNPENKVDLTNPEYTIIIERTEGSSKESVVREAEDVNRDGGAGDCAPDPEEQTVPEKKDEEDGQEYTPGQ
ncbi:hypothetical protein GJAV_G00263920 [Gymnothorax javanicus]|nr:hypothetical protein GJAV_G00263920 [Gymnothorax javanicus]